MTRCASCGAESPAGARFCMHCAASLPSACGACGAEVPKDARFCPQCAHPIGAATEPAASTRAAARNVASYTPKHLADRILQSRSALEGERKQVTVLFADVKGSMELAEQLDPEEWHQILERFFAILTEGVHRFEGTVNQYTGDGIMALFGAPIAHEDHAQRACYAALHLRDELARYTTEVKREHGISFSTRMGLNSGEVVVGRIGDDLRMDYTAQGHTVGLAQRMEALASPDTCYLSAGTAALVAGYFHLDDLGEFRLKGSVTPVNVHRLDGVGTLHSRFDISRARGLSRFVGRDADMQALEAALEQSSAGNGQVVGIVAEAGTGKSRLCFEFLERCRARGLTVNQSHAVSHGKNLPFLPILEVFRRSLDINDTDPERVVREKIAGRLLLADEGLRELLPVVFEFFGVPDAQRPVPHLAPNEKQRQLFAALRSTLRLEDNQTVRVTLIEDLHWLDTASDAFLEQWVEATSGSRSLLLLNFRPEYHAPWMNSAAYRQIPLAPLSREAMQTLLAELLGTGASVAGLAESIYARTAGNPFFTEEVVQSLIGSGALVGAHGQYRLLTPVANLEVPATVQALLASRIDRLAEREKEVLQAASVIGKDFSEPVLRHIIDASFPVPITSNDLQAALRTLKDAGFINGLSLYPVALYTFRHPLTREVALRSQLQERRRRTHLAVAQALEALNPERLDEIAALIAQHHDEAGEVALAARWYVRAGERISRSVSVSTLHLWRRVRELAGQMAEGEESTALTLLACMRALAVGGWRAGSSTEEWAEIFEAGCAAANRAGDIPALVRMKTSFALSMAGERGVSEFLRMTAEAVVMADQTNDQALQCHARAHLFAATFHSGNLTEAERIADEITALSGGDIEFGVDDSDIYPALYAGIHRLLGIGTTRDPEAALRGLAQMRELTLAHGLADHAIWTLSFENFLRSALHARDEAIQVASEAVRIAEVKCAGNRNAELNAAGAVCSSLMVSREWNTLLDTATNGLAVVRSHGVTQHLFGPIFKQFIACAHVGRGEFVAAREVASDAIGQVRTFGFCQSPIPGLYGQLARAQFGLREPEADIAATLDEYESLITRTGMRLYEGELHELRAQLLQREGRLTEAASALKRAHQSFLQFGMDTSAERARHAAERLA